MSKQAPVSPTVNNTMSAGLSAEDWQIFVARVLAEADDAQATNDRTIDNAEIAHRLMQQAVVVGVSTWGGK